MGNVIQFPVDARGWRFCEDALGAKLGPEYPPEVQNRFIAAERAHALAISFHRGPDCGRPTRRRLDWHRARSWQQRDSR
jgi:hypothetical protein